MSVPDKIFDSDGNTWVKIPAGVVYTDCHNKVFHTPECRFVSYTILPFETAKRETEENIKDWMPPPQIGDVFGVDEVDDPFIATNFSHNKLWCVSKDQFNGWWGFDHVTWILRNGKIIWRRK